MKKTPSAARLVSPLNISVNIKVAIAAGIVLIKNMIFLSKTGREVVDSRHNVTLGTRMSLKRVRAHRGFLPRKVILMPPSEIPRIITDVGIVAWPSSLKIGCNVVINELSGLMSAHMAATAARIASNGGLISCLSCGFPETSAYRPSVHRKASLPRVVRISRLTA